MIYLILILLAFWNGYVIKWKLKNDKKATKIWHKIGFWQRVGLLIIGCVVYISGSWDPYIINPIYFLHGWPGLLVTISLFTWVSYIGYNAIINWVNGWKWFYLGKKKYGGDLYVYGSWAWIGLTIMGGMLAYAYEYF